MGCRGPPWAISSPGPVPGAWAQMDLSSLCLAVSSAHTARGPRRDGDWLTQTPAWAPWSATTILPMASPVTQPQSGPLAAALSLCSDVSLGWFFQRPLPTRSAPSRGRGRSLPCSHTAGPLRRDERGPLCGRLPATWFALQRRLQTPPSTCSRTWPRWHPSVPLGQEAPRCKGRTHGITNLGDQRTAGPRARSQAGMSGSYCLVWCSCQSMGTFEAGAVWGHQRWGRPLLSPLRTSPLLQYPCQETLSPKRGSGFVSPPKGLFHPVVSRVHLHTPFW